MYFKKSLNVLKKLLRFSIKRFTLYKFDSIMNIIASLIFLIGSIFFWVVITDAGFYISDWSLKEILIFIAFSELFFGIDEYLFSSASDFWMLIFSGNLDTQLTRPFDPRKRFIILNMNFIGLLTTCIKFVVIVSISKYSFYIPNLLIGIFIVIIGSISFMFLRFTISYLGFWLEKMDALTEICHCLTKFNKYPNIIFPRLIKLCFTTIFPFYFFSTFPAELVTNKLTTNNLIILCIAMIGNFFLWININKIVWKRGRKRYESLNG